MLTQAEVFSFACTGGTWPKMSIDENISNLFNAAIIQNQNSNNSVQFGGSEAQRRISNGGWKTEFYERNMFAGKYILLSMSDGSGYKANFLGLNSKPSSGKTYTITLSGYDWPSFIISREFCNLFSYVQCNLSAENNYMKAGETGLPLNQRVALSSYRNQDITVEWSSDSSATVTFIP